MIDPKTNPRVNFGTSIQARVRLGRRTAIPKDTFFGRAPFPLFIVAATASLLTGFAGSIPFPGFTAAATADTPRSVQGAIAFPQPSATGVGQTVNSGSAIATLPTPNIVSTGQTDATSTASITFPSVTVSGQMVSGSGFVGAIAFPQPVIAGVGQTVNSGIATLTMPLFIPSGSSVAEPSLSGNAAFPPFVVSGTGEADASNAWTFQAIATQLWLRGTDNVTLDGANVSTWADVKDTALIANQSVVANQPGTATLDGKTTVSTVGGKYLNLANTLQIRSAAFVVNNFQSSNSGAQVSVVFGEDDPVASSTDYVFVFIGPDYTISIDGNNGRTGRASLNGNPIASGTNILLEETYSAGGGPGIFYVDWVGAQVPVDYISAFNPENRIFQGSLEIAEIILFPEILSADDQDRAIGRLAHDWGQTGLLPINHPYKTQEPTIDIGFIGNAPMPTPVALGGATAIASGQSSILLTTPVGSGTAEVTASGQGAATMPLFVPSGTAEGEVSRAITGAILFSQPVAAATAGVTASGSAVVGLTTPQPSGTAEVETDATGSATFPGFIVAGTADGGASAESINATSVALRTSQLQDASVMGDVDWWIAGVDEKLNGTEITVTGGTVSSSTGAPIFKFNDGTTNTGEQQLTSQYQFGTTIPPLITVAIPAGSGRVSVWVGTGSSNDATFSAAFGLNFTGLINFSGDDRFDIDFVADSASTMAITLFPGSNADAGVYAVALATNSILIGTPAPDILWWPTTEAAGTNLNDPINGWIGFFEGTTISWDTDNFLLWAGGYVRNNNNALESLIETTSTGTAMCWVNPNDLTNDACIFTAKNNTTNEGRMYFLRGDPVGNSGGGTNVYKGGYRTSPTSGAQGVQFETANNDWALGWNHIAMSFATGSEPTPRFQFWKNGVLLPQANYTFYPTQFPDNTLHSQGNFIYGQQGNAGNPFSGKLYDLRLYEAELTTAQVQQIYDATKGVVGVT